MRWLVWLLVAVLAVAGVVAACGGGASEREVSSQRPAEQEAGSQRDAGGSLAGALGRGDDRTAARDRSASGGSEEGGARARWRDPVADERAAAEARLSSDASGSGGVSAGGPEPSDDARRIDVFPMSGSLTAQGPVALGPYPLQLPLRLAVGPYTCGVGVEHPAPDEAEGRFVVTFGDFDEVGSEAVVEAAGPEWRGAARLEVVESEDEDKMATTRAIPGMVGSWSGRQLTATIVSDLKDGMWRINCRRIYE